MTIASAAAVAPANRFERRKERTRHELLAAAIRVLAARGLAATKIADIAAEADVGVGTFYLHFATKEALLDALVEDTIGRLKATMDAARAAVDDPVERVRLANAALCRFAADNRQMFAIVFGPGAAYHDVVRRALAVFAADLENALRDGIARGAFVDLPTAVAAQAMVGMTCQLLAWWTERDDVPLQSLEETMTRLALDGLRAAPAITRTGA